MTGKPQVKNLQFQMSESYKPDAHQAYKDVLTTCSFHCGATETPLYYLYCSAIDAKTFTKLLL